MSLRRCSTLVVLLLMVPTLTLAQDSLGIAYKYARLPNTRFILPSSINNNNVVSGTYFDPSASHAFTLKKGQFTVVDFPGATFTNGTGINDNEVLVGNYALPQDSTGHGFILSQGVFTTIDAPGSISTFPADINNSGTVVGTYLSADSLAHGFIYINGTLTTVDAPPSNGGGQTDLLGINNAGVIVGFVTTPSGDVQGFWLDGSTYHYLNAAGRTSWVPKGINDHGDIIGDRDIFPFLSFAVPEQGVSNTQFFSGHIRLEGINDARILIGKETGFFENLAFIATSSLTIDVMSPANRTSVTNPVHVAAKTAGDNPVSQIEVWVNRQKIYSVAGGTLDAFVDVPVGTNERFVIKAVDSTGAIAKVVDMINVN